VGFSFLGQKFKLTEATFRKESEKMERREKQEESFDKFLSGINGKNTRELETALSSNESKIFRELVEGIREISYGSIVLVVHAGRLVEVTKTVRIRASRNSQEE
jgi:hypothetical protein